MIVDQEFDEESLDTSSMLPDELRIPKTIISSPQEDIPQDNIIVNGEGFNGKIRIFSISHNRLTKQKVIKVIIDCQG